jgi:hypothetical protein
LNPRKRRARRTRRLQRTLAKPDQQPVAVVPVLAPTLDPVVAAPGVVGLFRLDVLLRVDPVLGVVGGGWCGPDALDACAGDNAVPN